MSSTITNVKVAFLPSYAEDQSLFFFFHFRPDDNWSIQLKRLQVISKLELVMDNLSLYSELFCLSA